MSLPDFQLEIFFSRWEFAARHNLAASDPETLTMGELLAYGERAVRRAAALLRADVDGLVLRAEDGWALDLSEPERLLRPTAVQRRGLPRSRGGTLSPRPPRAA